jgi:signal transduction histidine kinase
MVAQEPQYRNGKRTVLIADDDRTLAKAIAVMLGQSGLQTVVAHDGEQALAMARAMLPDLILLDMNIPVKSGPEVYATLKADSATAAIPVVFLSGEPEKTDRTTGPAAGAAAYLTKPFSPTELIELVQRTIASQPVDPPGEPDPSHMSADQLVVYAQELRELFEREQDGRQSLQEERQRLEELDRLRMGFLGTVTHELLIPFPAIGKALQVLQRQSHSLDPDQRVALDNLMTEIAGLHRMVSGVDKFVKLVNRRREPQPQDISLSQVIPWAVQPAAVLAQARDVDFRLFVPSHLTQVHADPALLGEAIFQMAHNAVKFNLPGGRAHVRALESDGWVVIEVTDTGVGLTPERLELLDQSFEELADAQRRERQGLGVGWAFVRYVAEAHGGSTRVSSPGPGEGSTFALSVPAALQVHEIAVASQVPVEA